MYFNIFIKLIPSYVFLPNYDCKRKRPVERGKIKAKHWKFIRRLSAGNETEGNVSTIPREPRLVIVPRVGTNSFVLIVG